MSIELKEVTYCYMPGTPYERYALRQVSVSIQDGSFTAIAGHTGSGKSTLVQHLNGLLQPSSGQVLVDGIDLKGTDKEARAAAKAARRRVGMVFQYPEHQLFEVDVFSDVCFGPKNLGLPKKEVELRAYEALKMVGLEDEFFYQSPFDLSGGQKRRVAIAGVIAMKPQVLILDEPTAGLDPKGREEILNMIRELHEKMKCTIILVSHSMDDVADYAERIIVMNHGEVFLDGTPKEVFYHKQELEEIGLAVPTVTDIMHQVKELGYPVDESVTTLSDAAEALVNLYHDVKGTI